MSREPPNFRPGRCFYTTSGMYGDMEFMNGTAAFALKHGEWLTAFDLPVGIGYTVTENHSEGYTLSSAGESGIIPSGQNAEAVFHNHKDKTAETDPDPALFFTAEGKIPQRIHNNGALWL